MFRKATSKKSPHKKTRIKKEYIAWCCQCGHYEESWNHCSKCHAQPPWGCQCSDCDNFYDDDLDFGFFADPYFR